MDFQGDPGVIRQETVQGFGPGPAAGGAAHGLSKFDDGLDSPSPVFLEARQGGGSLLIRAAQAAVRGAFVEGFLPAAAADLVSKDVVFQDFGLPGLQGPETCLEHGKDVLGPVLPAQDVEDGPQEFRQGVVHQGALGVQEQIHPVFGENPAVDAPPGLQVVADQEDVPVRQALVPDQGEDVGGGAFGFAVKVRRSQEGDAFRIFGSRFG